MADTEPKPAPAGQEPPEWLTETPAPASFALQALDGPESTGTVVQGIELTRSEFQALKQHLARLRGIPLPADIRTAAA